MWLVAKTEPKKERWVAENIARQGYSYYLPQYKDGKHVKFLFPSYIFCHTNGPWTFLSGTYGVLYVLTFGNKPGIVQDEVIQAIKDQEDEFGYVTIPEDIPPPLQRGQRVLLRSGPFSGYIGIYEGQSSRDRERILLDLLGGKKVVHVKRDQIEDQ